MSTKPPVHPAPAPSPRNVDITSQERISRSSYIPDPSNTPSIGHGPWSYAAAAGHLMANATKPQCKHGYGMYWGHGCACRFSMGRSPCHTTWKPMRLYSRISIPLSAPPSLSAGRAFNKTCARSPTQSVWSFQCMHLLPTR